MGKKWSWWTNPSLDPFRLSGTARGRLSHQAVNHWTAIRQRETNDRDAVARELDACGPDADVVR